MALRAVHEDRNGEKIGADWKLAAGENGAGRDTELMIAGFALEQRAGLVACRRRHTGNAGKRVRRSWPTSE